MLPDALLESVPDWGSWSEARDWLEEGLALVAQLSATAGEPGRFMTTSVTAPSPRVRRFGMYGDSTWRRQVLATFVADLVSYAVPVNQVSFDRLAFVMHAFPTGFRVFWAQGADGRWWPVGYSGWYPVLPSTFALLSDHARSLRDRMVAPAPAPTSQREGPFVYLFNYSVAHALRRTALSSSLVKRLAADVAAVKPAGLATIAVSADGCGVAERFGMKPTGTFMLDGEEEIVLVARFGSS